MRRVIRSWLLLVSCLWPTNWVLAAPAAEPPIQTAQAQSNPPSPGHGPAEPPGQGETKPKSPKDTPAATRARTEADPPITTFSVQGFQTDLFTGASTAEIPIVVPPGPAGVAPKIVLRYNSGVVDELGVREQGQGAGLGWTLDTGGFVLRDTKLTTSPNDDTFKVVFGGASHDLVLVNAGQNIYHTKEETFWELKYNSQSDYWTLKTKDGTVHRFGFNNDSRATALGQDLVTPVTYKYFLDEVTTTSGVSVRYSYVKQTATVAATGQSYDQAVYPNIISYAYHSGLLVGPVREVRFLRAPRTDWTDTSASTHVSFFERDRLDAIEVRVGTSLVGKYLFGFDYSIDRDPTFTWDGGATGDLTLKTVTMLGTDGASALPALTFTYSNGRLASANNGIGGTVSYSYERVPATAPLYLMQPDDQETGCSKSWHLSHEVPPGHACGWKVFGYASTTTLPGTVPLYLMQPDNQETGCSKSWHLSHEVPPGHACGWKVFGYLYAGPVDRHRVTSRTISNGLGWSATTAYTYNGLGLSSDGKEFRGHAAVRATDPLGNYTDTWFKQDDILKGHPYQIEARSSTGALFTRVANTWSATNPHPGVTFVTLSRVDTHDCDGGPSCEQTAQSFEYDALGNPTRTFQFGDVAITGDERDERTDWLSDTTNWIFRPTRTALHDSAGALLREKWLSYDSRGLLTREEIRLTGLPGAVGNPVVTHSYNAFGNKTSTTDPRGCTTNTAYDTSQTFPVTVTTCLGHTTSFQYDDRFGVVTSQTDPNGQTATSTYDALGRLTKVTGPLDGTSTYGSVSHFYLDWGNPSLQRVQTFRTEQHGTANVIWSEEFFDGLGRVDTARSEGPGGQIIQAKTTFDARGLVAAKSAPHFSTETPVWTQFTYDPIGRQIQVTHPDGTVARASYAPGLITLTDERGSVKRRYLDAYDRLIKVEEINGLETYTTTYQYDTTGALTRVTNHFGHVTTMGYDMLGRKTSMSDPNMGVWNYSYDPGGNLISQTDAKGQSLTFSYDLQSRLLTKRYPDGRQITWTYDDPAVANSKGRLTRVVDLSATTSFTYDVLGRVTQTQRTIDGVTYTMSQSYDALGRVISETFPDSDSVTYTYNEAGWLSSISGYINSISYNARGQRTSLQYANGLTSTWTYNAQNFRVTNHTTSGVNGTFQNFSYGYDAAGNITSITDSVRTGSRSFSYDALNRLTQATGNFGTNQSLVTHNYRYDAIGNILEKGGVVYSYTDPLHPSAVTSTSDGKSYTYDAIGNMLTGGNRSFTWDADNRLSSVTTAGATLTMAYDYTGIRVKKTSSSGITYFPYSGYQIEPNGVITKYIRIGIDNVASKKSTGEKLFYHNDHLGGVNVTTNTSGLMAQIASTTRGEKSRVRKALVNLSAASPASNSTQRAASTTTAPDTTTQSLAASSAQIQLSLALATRRASTVIATSSIIRLTTSTPAAILGSARLGRSLRSGSKSTMFLPRYLEWSSSPTAWGAAQPWRVLLRSSDLVPLLQATLS